MENSKIKEIALSLTPEEAADRDVILKTLKKKRELKKFPIKDFRIVRRSIDARRGHVKINLGILVTDREALPPAYLSIDYQKLPESAKDVIIIGAGPAGLFAALEAIESGLRPIVIERGKDVDKRKLDIAAISRQGKISPDSNYCFGEGGAGTYSDGKLYTRSKKRGNIRKVLEILCQFGADENILIDAHPHIGSDKLPKIIKSIREKIIECGGKVLFDTKMNHLLIENNEATGVETTTGEIFKGPVFLATGHSARDTYEILKDNGVELESKGLAIGVRLEHPQALIDKMQYHNPEGRGAYLPPAEYSFVTQSEGRGVYSFCMCPGGVIVPAVSDTRQIVVNGMSASARSGKWANSGYVVELHPGDVPGFEQHGVFEMMELQKDLERKFSNESGGTLNAPAQRINDFIKGEVSLSLPVTSYAPGIHSSNLHELFPSQISERLKNGLSKIGEKCPDFISPDGVMIGLETRTSSPIRIPRDSETLEHIRIRNLYPMGEGAGYAGGIVSSALDGINCIDAYNKKIRTDGSNT